MKNLLITLIFALIFLNVCAQTDIARFKKDKLSNKYFTSTEHKGQFASSNFSVLWTQTDNKFIYGFIGQNFQRLRIKFLKIVKDSVLSDTYRVYGKTLVRDNLTNFTGMIKISTIRKYKNTNYGVDDEYKKMGIKGEYIIVGNYLFSEDKKQLHSGNFNGVFATAFYLDKNNKIKYDNIEIYADGFSNNEFVGSWTEYISKKTKKCNWGDYRIPYSVGFDVGAGEFSPDKKYYKFGWEDFQYLYTNDFKGSNAKKKEYKRWWQ